MDIAAKQSQERETPSTNSRHALLAQIGQWVLLGGSSTVRSAGGAETRERSVFFATYAVTMGSLNGSSAWSALVLEDPGVTENLITHKFASILHLSSMPETFLLKLLGYRHETTLSRAYKLCIFDMYGRKRPLTRGFI